ncbi:hypothetical protein MRB53_040472 [Persea americana]|nr:hypothetical protein MRB53_040472 [Persea americana]
MYLCALLLSAVLCSAALNTTWPVCFTSWGSKSTNMPRLTTRHYTCTTTLDALYTKPWTTTMPGPPSTMTEVQSVFLEDESVPRPEGDKSTATEYTTVNTIETITGSPTTTTSTTTSTVVDSWLFPGTRTVPVPSGFLPANTTLPQSPMLERSSSHDEGMKQRFNHDHEGMAAYQHKMQPYQSWAQGVQCIHYTAVLVTATLVENAARPRTEYTPASTITEVSTTTIYTPPNALEDGDATTTILETRTLTSLETFISTSTTESVEYATVTIRVSSATDYAQCSLDNYVGAIQSHGIDGVATSSGMSVTLSTEDARGCCIACAVNAGCRGSMFNKRLSGNGNCRLEMVNDQQVDEEECKFEESMQAVRVDESIETDKGWVVSNGGCGGFEGYFVD